MSSCLMQLPEKLPILAESMNIGDQNPVRRSEFLLLDPEGGLAMLRAVERKTRRDSHEH